VLKVHNGDDVKLNVRDTQWGPITAADADGTPLALAWTALQPGGLNFEFLRLDTAESVDEAVEIANASGLPGQNFVVGDRAGNIGWTIAGKIPRREGGYDPLLPSDWSQAGVGWNGWLTPQEYTLTVATQNADGSSHDWVDDAIAFEVVDARSGAGVANLRAEVTWTKRKQERVSR